MTRAAQGDKLALVSAGAAASPVAKWRGGRGVLIITSPNATPAMEMQADDGTWVAVKDINGTAVAAAASANMWNVELPACPVRMATAGGTMNAVLIGV